MRYARTSAWLILLLALAASSSSLLSSVTAAGNIKITFFTDPGCASITVSGAPYLDGAVAGVKTFTNAQFDYFFSGSYPVVANVLPGFVFTGWTATGAATIIGPNLVVDQSLGFSGTLTAHCQSVTITTAITTTATTTVGTTVTTVVTIGTTILSTSTIVTTTTGSVSIVTTSITSLSTSITTLLTTSSTTLTSITTLMTTSSTTSLITTVITTTIPLTPSTITVTVTPTASTVTAPTSTTVTVTTTLASTVTPATSTTTATTVTSTVTPTSTVFFPSITTVTTTGVPSTTTVFFPSQTTTTTTTTITSPQTTSISFTPALSTTQTHSTTTTTTTVTVTVTPGTTTGFTTTLTGGDSCGYPFASFNPLTGVVFNENEVLRAFGVDNQNIKLWYNDEHALLLGANQITVKTGSGTSTTLYPLSTMPSNPGGVVNPLTGSNSLTGDQAAVDPQGRPLWPSLFITDITGNPSNRAGDWQFGGTPVNPNAVFGVWKAASIFLDKTRTPNVRTVNPAADPASNNWNLDGGDPAPPGLVNQGFGAEVRWDVNALIGSGKFLPGHSYRLQLMVHDGDQNKVGGDVGEACASISIPGGGPAPPSSAAPPSSNTLMMTPVVLLAALFASMLVLKRRARKSNGS